MAEDATNIAHSRDTATFPITSSSIEYRAKDIAFLEAQNATTLQDLKGIMEASRKPDRWDWDISHGEDKEIFKPRRKSSTTPIHPVKSASHSSRLPIFELRTRRAPEKRPRAASM